MGTDAIAVPGNLDEIAAATLCLINEQRRAHGLAGLRLSAPLTAAAQGHSDDMVARDYFDHVTPSGVDLLSRVLSAGYATLSGALTLGENIAAGTGTMGTPSVTVDGWMNSPEHRANILNPAYTATGIGVAVGVPASLGLGGGGATYTECFATTS